MIGHSWRNLLGWSGLAVLLGGTAIAWIWTFDTSPYAGGLAVFGLVAIAGLWRGAATLFGVYGSDVSSHNG